MKIMLAAAALVFTSFTVNQCDAQSAPVPTMGVTVPQPPLRPSKYDDNWIGPCDRGGGLADIVPKEYALQLKCKDGTSTLVHKA